MHSTSCHSRRRARRTEVVPQHAPVHSRRRSARRLVPIELLVAVFALTVIAAPLASADTTHVLAAAATAADVSTVLNNIRNWIMGILALAATIFLTIGGLRYLMAGGDPGEVSQAKVAFKSAAIGYGLAALAPVIVAVLQQIIGPTS